MKHGYTLTYQSISLRPVQISDLEDLRAWRNNTELTRYLTPIPEISPDQQIVWFEKQQKIRDSYTFSVTLKSELVGSLSLYDKKNSQAEFGRILIGKPAAQGKGIGTFATVLALYFGFNILHLEKIIAHVFNDNLNGKKAFLKAGFRLIEGQTAPELNLEISASQFLDSFSFLSEIEVK